MIKRSKEKIITLFEDKELTPGNILLVCLVFWLTVMTTRIVIFWSVIHGVAPAIIIRGWHIHHFITGFFLLAIALVLLSKEVFSKHIPLALIGCGSGLVIDESLYWTRGSFNYWSLVNLAAILLIGSAMVITYVITKRDNVEKKYDALQTKRGPSFFMALLPVIILAIMLFVMFSYRGLNSSAAQSIKSRTTSEREQPIEKLFKK